MTDYLIVTKESEYSFTVSRSKFICELFPAAGVDEALEKLTVIKKKYPGATHYCYAVIGTPASNEFKFSDAGEPSGTAGLPILGVLRKNGLYETAAVVIRYFGGIKLGAGGLVNAYTKAAAGCIKEACIGKKRFSLVMDTALSYAEHQAFISRIQGLEGSVLDTLYGDGVQLTFAVPEARGEETKKIITEITSGAGQCTVKDKNYILYER